MIKLTLRPSTKPRAHGRTPKGREGSREPWLCSAGPGPCSVSLGKPQTQLILIREAWPQKAAEEASAHESSPRAWHTAHGNPCFF